MSWLGLPAALRKTVILTILLVIWEAVTRLGDVSPLLFPSASIVLAAFGRSLVNGELGLYHLARLLQCLGKEGDHPSARNIRDVADRIRILGSIRCTKRRCDRLLHETVK